MIDLVQAPKIRHKFNKEVVDNFIEGAKILAGPSCDNFSISKYHVNIYITDPEIKKLYSFYCPDCEILLIEY